MHGMYIGDQKMLVKTLWGGKLIISSRDLSLMPDLVTAGAIELALTKYIINEIKEGDIVIDVGANVGYFSVLSGLKVGNSGKVYAYEANKSTFGFLMDNIAINYLKDRVVAFNEAVYSEKGEVSFYTTERFTGNASIHKPDQEYYDYFLVDQGLYENKVAAVPLDIYAGIVDTVKLIKIDVEGGELHCFLGMEELLRQKKVGTVIFELNMLRMKEDTKQFLDLLKGYEARYGATFGILDLEGRVVNYPLDLIFTNEFVPSVVMQVQS